MNDETAVEQIDPQSGEDVLAQAFSLLDSFAGEGLGHAYVDGQWVFANLIVGQLTEAFGLDCDAGWWRLLANRLAATKPIGDGWRDIATAPAPTGPDDEKILVIGGVYEEPQLVQPDGDWWRKRKREGGRTFTHWMRVPAFQSEADDPLPVLKVKQLDKGEL